MQDKSDKARQGKTTQDTRTRHQDKTRQHTKAGKTRHDKTTTTTRRHGVTKGQTVTVNYFLPVLFFKSYILIQILVLSGYYNIGTKDRSQKLGPSSQKSPIYVALCITSFSQTSNTIQIKPFITKRCSG